MTSPSAHFDITDGTVAPQPWMQLRHVAGDSTPSVFRTYASTGGVNKNEVYQTLTVSWTNNSPIAQYVYGLVTVGGSSVALQARSRGYIQISHSLDVWMAPRAQAPSPLVVVSKMGGGADLGVGGQTGLGVDFGMHEIRSHSTTAYLMPHLTGWTQVDPGYTFTAHVEVRFISERWEATSITNGPTDTEAIVIAGDLLLDVFAVPMIGAPLRRTTPTVVSHNAAMETSKDVRVGTPAGTMSGDVLLAIVGNNFNSASSITAPAGWALIHAVNIGDFDWFDSHVKVFAKVAGDSEPSSYVFGNGFGAEQIVELITLRGATAPSTGADADGWSIGSTRAAYSATGNQHVAPSMVANGQLLICASFFGLAANILAGQFGVVQVRQTVPPGFTELLNLDGANSSMCVGVSDTPTNPTGEQSFSVTPRPFYAGSAVTLAILVAGQEQFD